MTAAVIAELHGVAKSYGAHQVFRGVDLTLHHSEILGIIGPNGVGKTTLLRILVGLIRPTQGTIRYQGEPLPRRFSASPVSFFGGEATMPPGVRARRWGRLIGACSDVDDRRRLRTLSRGTRQLVGLKAALGRPDVTLIVLDEPWEGLDPDASRWLTATLRDQQHTGASIVVSSHRLGDLANLCSRYAFLGEGRLTAIGGEDLRREGVVTSADLLSVYDRLKKERP